MWKPKYRCDRAGPLRRIPPLARERDVALVVVGSENAGQVVSAIGSVGNRVAADEYDGYLVRTVRDDDSDRE